MGYTIVLDNKPSSVALIMIMKYLYLRPQRSLYIYVFIKLLQTMVTEGHLIDLGLCLYTHLHVQQMFQY